ncbi:MAG: NAD-dependent epimerase/dehydratase family protein [Acidimicrobiales bacterium]
MTETPRVLVSGGAGFIGCPLTTRLLEEGYDVFALDCLHEQVHQAPGRPRRLPEAVVLLPGDVTRCGDVEAALRLARPEVLVHLAAETGTGQSLTAAALHANVNVTGTAHLLDGLARSGLVEHVVLASSRAVYGEGSWTGAAGPFSPELRTRHQLERAQWEPVSPDGSPATPLPSRAGTTEPRPASIYAATKLAQEHLAGAWAAGHGIPLSVLRLQNVFGPGQSLSNPYSGVAVLFAATALRGEAIDVYEDGGILRDFVFVDDAVQALVAAVERPPVARRTLDIGSGATTRLVDLARHVAARCDAPEPVVSGRFRPGDVRAASCDISAAAEHLDYQPTWTLERGVDALLAWVQAAAVR